MYPEVTQIQDGPRHGHLRRMTLLIRHQHHANATEAVIPNNGSVQCTSIPGQAASLLLRPLPVALQYPAILFSTGSRANQRAPGAGMTVTVDDQPLGCQEGGQGTGPEYITAGRSSNRKPTNIDLDGMNLPLWDFGIAGSQLPKP